MYVNNASGRIVAVYILELCESPCSGVAIFCASMGLGRQLVIKGIIPETDEGAD